MWFLYDNENPASSVRSNGKRFWGYPSRTRSVRAIVVHTAEIVPDTVGTDNGAEAIARFFSRSTRPASYHVVVDSDSAVRLLPPQATAFGAVGANADGWHVSFATRAADWNRLPREWVFAAVARAAEETAPMLKRFNIPAVKLTRQEFLAGRRGIVSHADVDPARRSDPGRDFPWDLFIGLLNGTVPSGAVPASETEKIVKALPVLRRRNDLGRASDADRRLQGLLAAAGVIQIAPNMDATNRFDGKFGPSTERAVRTFQANNSLGSDGVVGSNTWAALLGV